MAVDIVIKNGKIVTSEGIFEAGVAVDEGKIVMIAKDPSLPVADQVIDAKGNYIFPGCIDPHTHLGIYSGDLALEFRTETSAAARAGTTTLLHCLISKESHNKTIPEAIATVEKNAVCNIGFYASIGTSQHVDELQDYIAKGVTSFKWFFNRPEYEAMFGAPMADDGQIFNAWQKLRDLGGLPMCHCENFEIARVITEKIKKSGKEAYPSMWNDCRPGFCEYESMQKAAFIAKIAKTPVYIVHTSIGNGIDIAMRARQEGVEIYVETCPQYLTRQTDEPKLKLIEKVNPPLRFKEDNEKLWWGIKAGIVDTIGTDSAACKMNQKMGKGDIWTVLLDWSGTDTMFPVVLTEGLKRGVPLERIAQICATNTARIMGIPNKGAIKVGNDADLVIVDLGKKTKLRKEDLLSYGDFNLWEGWELIYPIITISNGKIVAENGKVIGKPGMGKFIKRIPRTRA